MKDAVVRLVCSLHEIVDICIEDSTRKVLSVIIQTDKKLEKCEGWFISCCSNLHQRRRV